MSVTSTIKNQYIRACSGKKDFGTAKEAPKRKVKISHIRELISRFDNKTIKEKPLQIKPQGKVQACVSKLNKVALEASKPKKQSKHVASMISRFNKLSTSHEIPAIRGLLNGKVKRRFSEPTSYIRSNITKMDRSNIEIHRGFKLSSLMDREPVSARITIGKSTYNVHSMGKSEDGQLKGKGIDGRVLVGKDQSGKEIAIKISAYQPYSPSSISVLRKEARLQCRLNGVSQHILGAKCAGEHNGMIFIVMDHIKGGQLFEFITENKRDKHFTRQLMQYVRDAAKGLEDLHAQEIVHGDPKLENIFCHNGRGVLFDFGFSGFLERGASEYQAESGIGSYSYIAPELHKKYLISKKTDVFAFGVLIYNAFSDKNIPWTDTGTPDFAKIPWSNFQKENGQKLTELAKACLLQNPKSRLSMYSVRDQLDFILSTMDSFKC